jgi:signal transduction histidine kinase
MNSVSTYEKEIVAIILYTSCFFMLLAFFLIVFFYYSRKKVIQKEIEKRDMEILHQREQLYAVIMTQEEERKRIAQDLHDDISSKLNIVSLNSYLLSAGNLTSNETKEITDNIISMTAKALENSRKIAHNLLPPVFDKFGLHAGIEELCEEFESTKLVKVNYKNSTKFEDEEKEKHLHVFRILQELMNNSVRHGKATEIEMSFTDNNGKKKCYYRDNGIGFDSSDPAHMKGLGMKNIDSRISFINGKCEIISSPGRGIEVFFTF